jgi:hypothetical protein
MSRKRIEGGSFNPGGSPSLEDGKPGQCVWDRDGNRCMRRGTQSDATNGAGPWYCRVHYRELNGWPKRPEPETADERYARRMARFEVTQ